jgi:hypothetical protein
MGLAFCHIGEFVVEGFTGRDERIPCLGLVLLEVTLGYHF